MPSKKPKEVIDVASLEEESEPEDDPRQQRRIEGEEAKEAQPHVLVTPAADINHHKGERRC